MKADWYYRFSDGAEAESLLDALVYLKLHRALKVVLVSPDGEEDVREKLALILDDHPYGTGR